MTYKQAIDFLYSTAPMFQSVGKKGYKEGLENTFFLDKYFGYPHHNFRSIHVAGTNGKGSTSHLIASVLQEAGYKVGLYTSPHLKDFTERVRINGEPISKRKVAAFICDNRQMIEKISPSFFEITTALAFNYFAKESVDLAVIEVGLGGRLDCTNIISPMLSVITNISLDHTDFLGDTLEKIAVEKAGIIKPETPVVIGETQKETTQVFLDAARRNNAKIIFADHKYSDANLPECQLKGLCQDKNMKTVLASIDELKDMGLKILKKNVTDGFKKVVDNTSLMGRWQTISTNPTVVCDTAHNKGGLEIVMTQLKKQKYNKLHIVFGMMSDKVRDEIYLMLPKDATYYFTKASLPRSLNEKVLQKEASQYGLCGSTYKTVKKALSIAKRNADRGDLIYVGGSSFIVAEAI